MSPDEVRKNFLSFFSKRDHKVVPSSPLVDKTDASVLLTSAGMQQFKPYFTGEKSALEELGALNTASIQKCFRTSDINEVGDATHLTFFEMLGNFSFGGYFKSQAIEYAYALLKDEFKITHKRMSVTVFRGDSEVPRDDESIRVWQKLGFSKAKGNLRFAGRDDNFWGPTGQEGPCGATSEIYVDGVEIWNLVFNEYYCHKNKEMTPLEQKGVDTGMGLERLMMVLENKKSVFATTLFQPLTKVLVEALPEQSRAASSLETLFLPGEAFEKELEAARARSGYLESVRIITDHMRGAVFLAAEGLAPSNIQEGYVLRRMIRRSIRHAKKLELAENWLENFIGAVLELYGGFYPELPNARQTIVTTIKEEQRKFERTLSRGLAVFSRLLKRKKEKGLGFSAQDAFKLYETFGFPVEITEELLSEEGIEMDYKQFERAFEKHRQASRGTRQIGGKKIGGIRANPTQKEIRLHTATHLLHQALRDVLGDTVRQMGSDISEQRLRFDFSFKRKLTDDEKRDIERIVNEKINASLPVYREELPYEEALKAGALAFFKEKYPPVVSVYSIGGSVKQERPSGAGKNLAYSREVCHGPHVENTRQIGRFRILKEEAVGAGIRRIKGGVE